VTYLNEGAIQWGWEKFSIIRRHKLLGPLVIEFVPFVAENKFEIISNDKNSKYKTIWNSISYIPPKAPIQF